VTSIFAHRGASHVEPENTVAAFVRARELGADGVELDVRRHESGTLAVAHDAVLGAPLAPSVPDLATALDACDGMRVNIEIKNYPGDPDFDETESLAERVVELLHARDGRDDVFVSSFGLSCINRVRELDPSISTAFLVVHAPDDDAVGRIIDRTRRHGHGGVNPHHGGVTPHLVELAHAAGLTVNTWTVDDPARIRELASWGVDAIITNVPDVARTALTS
jgi:glycerophosphoryl diester phosphodiesterase